METFFKSQTIPLRVFIVSCVINTYFCKLSCKDNAFFKIFTHCQET